jgi:4-alpha-glucanotransferase
MQCDRRLRFEAYAAEHPYLDDYARFRAVGEQLRTRWSDWPEAMRNGTIGPSDYSAETWRYHMYVQWLAEEQLEAAAGSDESCGLYLDLPLGVNSNGYDVWRERSQFASGVAGGCPPDVVFPEGQNWGFVPLHPRNIRADGYRYVRNFVRHQMKHASVLRIDHMPSFHRIFWIPPGAAASEGVYVRYPADELYAVFSLESHRHETMLVGEDLGTVPPEVPAAMDRHNIHRMYVVQYELQPDTKTTLPAPPATSIASLNTHDMPPFAGFWQGVDCDEREQGGVLPAGKRQQEEDHREALRTALIRFLRQARYLKRHDDATAVFDACLAYLGDGEARMLLVSLEDLWMETHSQNVPTANNSIPNWRRKARLSWEEFSQNPRVLSVLQSLSAALAAGRSNAPAVHKKAAAKHKRSNN